MGPQLAHADATPSALWLKVHPPAYHPVKDAPFPVPSRPLLEGSQWAPFRCFLSTRLGVDARPNTGLVRLPGSDPHRQALRVFENGRGEPCVGDCQYQSVAPAPPSCQAVQVLALGNGGGLRGFYNVLRR